MNADGNRSGSPVARLKGDIDDLPAWIRRVNEGDLGEPLIEIREAIDRLEAVFADGLRRFDKSREFAADGALSAVAWLRWKCKLSGGAAAERVTIARQLEKLAPTEEAFARGDVGYQHVAIMARSAENVGSAAVRKQEAKLLEAAQTMDPGRFVSVVKDFEHRVDAEGALAEANRAHARRYLHISQPDNGAVRLDGLLDAEGGATLHTALNALMRPSKNDQRTTGQRKADALVELCRRQLSGSQLPEVAGQRPHLVIRASVDTLVGSPGAPAGELDWGGTIPAETVRRLACDALLTRMTSSGRRSGPDELRAEIGHASRTIPLALRRALAARDHGCVFEGCDRPAAWTDGHHLIFWTDGGPTTLENLAQVCRPHHRKVHEEGWRLERLKVGGFLAIPPGRRVAASARSA